MGTFVPVRQIGVGAVTVSAKEKRYVMEVLGSNRLSYGPFSRRLEREFANAHGCRHCVLTNSGTSSLQIAIAALKENDGWSDGDEILCPSVTFVASSNTILQNNMVPVFVDVERDCYGMDPAQIERHITPKTRAIMVVHLYGQPCTMGPIVQIAKRRGLRIIEDSCETMYARYDGKMVGSLSDIACFSSYAAHIMVTGVGGLTTTNDAEIAVMLRSLANHGRDNIYIAMDDDAGKKGDALREVMERRFRFVRMGYSYRMTEMEAAIGCGQLEDHVEQVRVRRANAKRLLEGLKRWEKYVQLPSCRPDREHSYMNFSLVIRDGAPFTREEITLFLEERMVETRHMVSILDQPYYHELFGKDIEEKYPVAKWIDRNGFYIGCHQEITPEVCDYILGVFAEFFGKYG
jgi:dTDP-4-amino-4,6-dideoxygalactose transaminase